MDKTIGERIKIARNRAGLTQKKLANPLNITYPTLNKYYRGHRWPNAEVLIGIINELGCSPNWLLMGRESS
ncbi:MAG: helix-turn-helix transcriptional regulator [Thermodesulfobacteriota bacterium]